MSRKLTLIVFSFVCILSVFMTWTPSSSVMASTVGVPLVCSSGQYSLEKIEGPTSYKKINCYSTLSQAISAMNASGQENLVVRHSANQSPMKIVAMDRGIVVNVPGKGSTSSESTTSLIYKTADFSNTNGRSYITRYHTLSYFGSAMSRGEIVYNIGITGFKGYIRASQADLVPMIYVENNWPVSLAGDGNGNGVISNRIRPNYYMVTPGTPNNEMNYYYSMINGSPSGKTVAITGYIKYVDSYITKISVNGNRATYLASEDSIRVRRTAPSGAVLDYVNTGYTFEGENKAVDEWIKISSYSNSSNAYNYASTTYGVAPDWLEPGIRYYSWDGIHFYTDIDMTQPVNNGAAYYNYFQFLPARSKTTHSAQALDKFVTDAVGNDRSAMKNTGQYFLKGQEDHFMNALMVHAMAINESGYGRSTYALDNNNLFGWNAVDSNPDNAKHFDSIEIGIDEHMGTNLNGFLQLSDWRYAGNGLGQKESGFNKQYASDAYWGLKISNFMYDLDKANGQKDLHNYVLGKFPDNSSVNVRKGPSTNTDVLYTTNSGLINTMAIVLEEVDGWYKIYLNNITDGTDVGYVRKDLLTIVDNSSSFDLRGILNAKITNNVLHGFNLTTTVKSVKDKITSAIKDSLVVVSNSSGSVKADNANLTTGDTLTVTLSDGTKVVHGVAIKGDVNGDGKINSLDVREQLLQINGHKTLTGSYSVSAEIIIDGKLNSLDVRQVLLFINGYLDKLE